MKKRFTKFALTVGFGLAMAFSSASAQGLYFDIGFGGEENVQETLQKKTQSDTVTWRIIKSDFSNQNEFFYAAEQGFKAYFQRYSPQRFSKDEESLIMTADYGQYYVKCIFFIDTYSQYIVIIETDFPDNRNSIKWIDNVVKQVRNLMKK